MKAKAKRYSTVKLMNERRQKWTDQFTDRYSKMILDYNLKLTGSDELCHRKTYYQTGMAVSK